jgi:hypothetical protein
MNPTAKRRSAWFLGTILLAAACGTVFAGESAGAPPCAVLFAGGGEKEGAAAFVAFLGAPADPLFGGGFSLTLLGDGTLFVCGPGLAAGDVAPEDTAVWSRGLSETVTAEDTAVWSRSGSGSDLACSE